jgi:hypothetical protein
MPVASPATDERPASTDRLPTLTEVVELGGDAAGTLALFGAALPEELGEPPQEAAPTATASAAPPPVIDEAALVEQVLLALAPRIDMLFEARLREAVAPALARAADGLIRETRDELGAVLLALVQEAVARALDRRA